MGKKHKRKQSIVDEYLELGTPSNYLFEEKIYKIQTEELKELEDETSDLIYSARNKITELEGIINELSNLVEIGEDKKRYIQACLHLGKESLDIIRYFNNVFNHHFQLSTIIAPKGYWSSGDKIRSIEEITLDSQYYQNCLRWLNENISAIESNKFNLTSELLQAANKYLLPLLITKKREFEEAQSKLNN